MLSLQMTCCTKCDQTDHDAANCPHFDFERVDDDAQRRQALAALASGDQLALYITKFKIYEQPKDDHCLYHSMFQRADFIDLELEENDPLALRFSLANLIEANPDLVLPGETLSIQQTITAEHGMTVQEYAEWMRTSNEWGGHLEIAAFCYKYRVPIIVFQEEEEGGRLMATAIYGDLSMNQKRIYLIYNGTHYDMLTIWAPEMTSYLQARAERQREAAEVSAPPQEDDVENCDRGQITRRPLRKSKASKSPRIGGELRERRSKGWGRATGSY